MPIHLENPFIRVATEEDLPAVLALYAQDDFDQGRVLSLEAARAVFSQFANYSDYRLYVAETDGRIMGSFALLVMVNLGHQGKPSAIVEDVVVSQSHQGQGIGRAMMAFALERCREKGCYKLQLSSNLKRRNAHAFYEALGFERHGFSYRIEIAPQSDPVTPSAA